MAALGQFQNGLEGDVGRRVEVEPGGDAEVEGGQGRAARGRPRPDRVADADLDVDQARLEGGDDVGDVAGEGLALGGGDRVEAGEVAQAEIGDRRRDLDQALEQGVGGRRVLSRSSRSRRTASSIWVRV